MSSTSDHGLPDPQAANPTAFDASQAILLVGGIVYAICCMPAIGQRGWPPIDPAWEAIPYLWFVPLILSGIFDRSPDRVRTPRVVVYALVTAFFDSGTMVLMSPRDMNPPAMLLATLIMFGPLHIMVAVLIEYAIRAIRHCVRWLLTPWPRIRLAVAWSFASLLTVGMIAGPFVWRECVFAKKVSEGRRIAEADWDSHQVRVFRSIQNHYRYMAERRISDEFDRVTGFEIVKFPQFFGFAEAYNQRVVEMVAERGIPDWSMKTHLPNDMELLAMFDSEDMIAVKDFPHQVTKYMALTFVTGQRDMTGRPAAGANEHVDIVTSGYDGPIRYHPSDLRIGLGEGKPVFVGRLPHYPHTVFVRMGRRSVYAFHESGVLLMSTN